MRSHATKLAAVLCVLAGCVMTTATAAAVPSVTSVFSLGSEVGTTIDNGPENVVKTEKRAQVRFRFSSSTPGVSFQCWLMRVTKKAQPAILKYKACNSPKTYRLQPGRYKFRVRAVVDSAPDLTPAVRNFKIVRIR